VKLKEDCKASNREEADVKVRTRRWRYTGFRDPGPVSQCPFLAHRHHHGDGYFRLGYHRAGPPHGYRFGFATYAGDPFARDDYYDGRGCYYLHHQDFCRGPKSLDWLRFR
jgi:hypothetical protein